MRKVIVNIATSADGFIARRDGGIDWLEERPRIKGDYGLAAFFRSVDTILYGRKTYDVGVKLGGIEMMAQGVDNVVFSRRKRRPAPGVRFIKGPIKPFMKRLRARRGKDIWMMGGGEIIASFLDAGEIDEFQIHVMPVFIGRGIPLIAPRHLTVPLKLLATRKFSDGVVRLHYAVERPARTQRRRR
jgi:dihydrofolate reductase